MRGGDTLLLDYRHRATIDEDGCLQEFKYKNADGKMISASFKLSQAEPPLILLTDGTRISLQNGSMKIMHGDMTLSYDNRQEFAVGYDQGQMVPPQLYKGINGR